jgi:hypothetical protein
MMLVITATGVLAVTGAIMIGMLMTADSRGGESLVYQTTIARLGAEFRRDVHAATDFSITDGDSDGQQSLILARADGSTITYLTGDGGLDRRVGDAGNVTRRERFRLPEGRAYFESASVDRMVRFVLEAPRQPMSEIAAGELPAPAIDVITLEAALRWDRRHSDAGQQEPDTGSN